MEVRIELELTCQQIVRTTLLHLLNKKTSRYVKNVHIKHFHSPFSSTLPQSIISSYTTTKNAEVDFFDTDSRNNVISSNSMGEESYFIEADMPAIQTSVISNNDSIKQTSDTVNGGGITKHASLSQIIHIHKRILHNEHGTNKFLTNFLTNFTQMQA